jgi:hypothetical protein
MLPGRSQNAIKNRFHSALKKYTTKEAKFPSAKLEGLRASPKKPDAPVTPPTVTDVTADVPNDTPESWPAQMSSPFDEIDQFIIQDHGRENDTPSFEDNIDATVVFNDLIDYSIFECN